MAGARVLLLVTGGIAAYKSCLLTRLLTQAGLHVRVGMTDAARRFVAPLTFRVLSGHPVATDLWGEGETDALDHIELARWADLVVVAPATANLLAKAAAGIADDIVTTLLVASEKPLVLAPAMNDAMWRHPATQANVRRLIERGAVIVEPGSGWLACGVVAEGRMSEPEQIMETVRAVAARPRPQAAGRKADGPPAPEPAEGAEGAWAGRRVVVTAGPTHEPIDAVRYIANRSTGVFGYAIAAEAAALGAVVTLVTGPAALPTPAGVARCLRVETADEMASVLRGVLAEGADWLIMSAAVADFAPAQVASGKLKKENLGTAWNLELRRTTDILSEVVNPDQHAGLRVVGFALETEDVLRRAGEKLKAKGMDFIVANDPTSADAGFGDRLHHVFLLGPDGLMWESGVQPKSALARGLLERLAPHQPPPGAAA